jgi:hypothetical protein
MIPLDINLHLLLITSLFIFGFNYATLYVSDEEHNILWHITYQSEKVFGGKWSKPICTCVVCMASVWGTLFYLTFGQNMSIQSYVIFVFALAGLNRILKNFI